MQVVSAKKLGGEAEMKACLVVSTYTPRKCGIATFSNDLRDNLLSKGQKVHIAAISEPFSSYVILRK